MKTEADEQEQARKSSNDLKKATYWTDELKASQKRLDKWQKQGNKINHRYIAGNANGTGEATRDSTVANGGFKLNLFHSNIKTLQSMLYGNIPTVDVSRRYQQSDDDAGRVAAECMERLLNNDIADNGAEYDSVLKAVLQDRLLAGLGCVKVRYAVETKDVEVPAPMDEMTGQPMGEPTIETEIVSETAPTDYFHWRDVLWGWGRTFSELPWIAFRSYLSKDEVTARFGDEAAKNMDFQKQRVSGSKDEQENPDNNDPTLKAEIWEIWNKEERTVVWTTLKAEAILESKADPLGLSGFYPTPPFFLANPTTSLYKPTPDFMLCQDLYNEIDLLQTRISIITEAVKVVGVYDASATSIKRMFKEGVENDLLPVDNWAMFSEKGGIKGQIDWVPIGDIVGALDKLIAVRDQTIGLLQQISGMADIMRGELSNQYEGVGQTAQKAKFGSIRVQALQDEFARFASDMMQLKAEIICKHFEPETIARRANMEFSPDAEIVPEALELLKDYENARIRVEIRPESVAMVDFAQLKNERVEYMNAISTFMQSSAPLAEGKPEAMPFILQLLQWGLAGFKGASEIEGVIDKAIEASQKAADEAAKNPPPDPAAQAAEMQQQMEQMKQQMEMQKIQAKAQADMQTREQDMKADMQTAQAQHEADIEKIQAELQAQLLEISAKMKADIQTEIVQSQANAEQAAIGTSNEIKKEVIKTELDIKKEHAKTSAQIATHKHTQSDKGED